MRLAITFLGLDLFAVDITTDPTDPTESAVECDDPNYLGDSTSYPVGFVAAHEIPDMAGPYREGWE